MSEPTPLDKAEAAVREASVDTAAVQLAFAAMELAKLAQQQPAPPQACQHEHHQGRSAGEWLAIGGAVCVGSIGLAFASIAFAIGGLSVAIVALVLRSMWRDFNKGR